MFGYARRQFGPTVLVCGLLLTQLQLLWMVNLHWNEEKLPSAACQRVVRGTEKETEPFDQNKSPCIVCQIVRQNAVRPSTASPMPQLSMVVWFQSVIFPEGFLPFQPSVASGRGPPLS